MTGTVRLHRAFAAPPETVYRAVLEPDAIASRLPPYGFCARHMRLTRRWAGGFRMSFRKFPTGGSHSFQGTYLGLTPNEAAGLNRPYSARTFSADVFGQLTGDDSEEPDISVATLTSKPWISIKSVSAGRFSAGFFKC